MDIPLDVAVDVSRRVRIEIRWFRSRILNEAAKLLGTAADLLHLHPRFSLGERQRIISG